MFEKKGIIFDAFGTLLRIRAGKHPFRQLMKLGRAVGRRPQLDDIRRILCNPWTLNDTAEAFGIGVTESSMLKLEAVLREEVEGIEPYPEAHAAIELLRLNGLQLVCARILACHMVMRSGAGFRNWMLMRSVMRLGS